MISKIDWQGHRGSRGTMPENTIPSFISAIDSGASTIEMDVVISKDLKVVISHEPYFSSIISSSPNNELVDTENEKSFNIYEMNYEEVKSWDVGSKPHPDFPLQKKIRVSKPLLSDTFKTIETYIKQHALKPVNYSIEIKCFKENELTYHPDPQTFTKLVLDTIREHGLMDKVIIQAFDQRVINTVNQYNANIHCSFLFQGEQKELYNQLKSLNIKPTIIGPQYKLVDKELVKYCHDSGFKIIPWTINDLETIKDLILMGVDGIITDFPNWLDQLSPFLSTHDVSVGSIL